MKKIATILLSVCLSFYVYSAPEMHIYTNEEYPTSFYAKDGLVTGFSTDIVREIQRRVQDHSKIDIYPWARAESEGLRRPNVVLYTVSRTPEREHRFHWIARLTTRRSVLWSKKGSALRINSLNDAAKVDAIGVVRGGNREAYLKRLGLTNLHSVTLDSQNIQKLVSDRVDLMFMSTVEAAALAKAQNISFSDLTPQFTVHTNDSYIVMSKTGTAIETVNSWRNAVRSMRADGTFEAIAQKWELYIWNNFGVETEFKDGRLQFWKDKSAQNSLTSVPESE